jgi:hypothetical protein
VNDCKPLARGARKPVAATPPKATDTAIIMYTSVGLYKLSCTS